MMKRTVFYDSIRAEATQIDSRFKASVGKPNYESLRWLALQKWNKLSLGGCSDSISSFRRFCNTLTDQNRTNWHGNYFSQYNEYARLVYCWDTERVPFEVAQRERDIFTVAQMASYNLLYLQYAENHGIEMDYESERAEIGTLLQQVQDCYNKSPAEALKPGLSTCTSEGKFLTVRQRDIPSPTTGIVYDAVYDTVHKGGETRVTDNRVGIEALGAMYRDPYTEGSDHLIRSVEKDWLFKLAADQGKTFREFMAAGKFLADTGHAYLSNSSDDRIAPLHFSPYFSYNYRYMYLDHFKADDSKCGTIMFTIKFRDVHPETYCEMDKSNRSNWNSCVAKHGDHWMNRFKHMAAAGFNVMGIVDSNIHFNKATQDAFTKHTVQGTIAQLEPQSETNGAFTLQTPDGQNIRIEYLDICHVEGKLENGAQATVEYTNCNHDGEDLGNYMENMVVNNQEQTLQGAVASVEDATHFTLTAQDGQAYAFRTDEKTQVNGTLEVGANAEVQYKALAEENLASQVRLTPQEQTLQGAVAQLDDATHFTLTADDGQNYQLNHDEKTQLTGVLEAGAKVTVTYQQLPGGNYATKIEVTAAPPAPPAPNPTPEPPSPGPAPNPTPEPPVPGPAPNPTPEPPAVL